MHRRSVVTLIAGVLLATGPASLASRAELQGFVGGLVWTGDDPSFGGFSAIEVAADGLSFTALTDRGALVVGRFTRDDKDRITRIDAGPPLHLALPRGPVPAEFRFDTEGLALGPDGAVYVSCEYLTRVLRYAAPDAIPVVLPIPREFVGMARNGGPESLSIDALGRLYTMPETPDRPDGSHSVYRFHATLWDRPFRITGDSGFLPVGSDIGPDGRLYVLERQFRGLGGFASRVRRFATDSAGLVPGETLVEMPPGYFGNLEGIAVWRDARGTLRLTMVSDDNFLEVLGTEIVEFRVQG